ncbi:MAG TPA: ATP-dependent sacrificial sulfur transferase LarE [Chitinispirillaceae bacterium]|nr:ATP-dependent sacrificial sulfur transferase LarE [Chitinispirillaceae bacterium]
MTKLEQLYENLSKYNGVVVAYSGGVDSTLLAYVAYKVLGEKMLAVTAVSPTYPESQLLEAKAIAGQFGFPLQIITTNEFEDPNFVNNPPDRCYYCKQELFLSLKRIADQFGYAVLDGANADDLADYRPGHRAAAELHVRSPLMEVGMTKADIRAFSKQLNLQTWNKPAYACLASRLPYGKTITQDILSRIDQGEQYLSSLGLKTFRLRDHEPLARIEVAKDEMDTAWTFREKIAEKLKNLGFKFITIDLEGFRSGSMNELLKKV